MQRPPRSSAFRRKIRNALLALIIGIVLALIGVELGMRFVVHHPKVSLGSLGKELRAAENYADGNTEDDFWKLMYVAQDPIYGGAAEGPDPITGWTGHYITPETYEHVEAMSISGRTPILLYGDSFAQCNTPPYECFQSILERSDLADRFCLVNYGVGGYGLDQIYLLLENSIDRYMALDPIVVVSVLVESDLDRSYLAFRCWPKPRFEVVGDELKPPGPVLTDPDEYIRQNPIGFPSFLWRYVIYRSVPALASWQESMRGDHLRVEEKRNLNVAILKEIERALAKRRVRYFVLLFHTEQGALAADPNCPWQEPLVVDTGRQLAMPIVETRPYLEAASRHMSGGISQLYGHEGSLNGHLNALGNLVAFEAIRQGVTGNPDQADTSHLESWLTSFAADSMKLAASPQKILGRTADTYAVGGADWVRVEAVTQRSAGRDQKIENLILHAGELIPTEVRFELEPGLRRFSAVVSTFGDVGAQCTSEEIELEVCLDGIKAWGARFRHGAEPVPIEIDITGHLQFALLVRARGASDECGWLKLEDLRFQ